MTAELSWGLPVVWYLFLAGLGAGALTASASVLLRGGGGGFGGAHIEIARYGAFLAPLPLIVGCFALIFELGSFEAGHWFRWINLYKVINLSPMSIGTWLLTFFIGVSLVYAYTFVPDAPFLGARQARLRKALAWISVPLGIATAVYTGILLGAMPARPFWNSPILALLFLLSSISTGVALILLARGILHRTRSPEIEEARRESDYLLTATDVLLIGFELMVIFLFIMYAQLTIGGVNEAVAVILPGGDLAALFWIGVVLIGLLIPALIELYYVVPKLVYHRGFNAPRVVDIAVSGAVLFGGFLLRYVVLVAGQVTGPIGI
ncbi:MAG: polysulfide reductase NrfD [Proteobacteria bacterium]|nr:polysulfide reductase NrfD [Pseudomonadota bacterium]